MKGLFILAAIVININLSMAQTALFESESNVISYMDGKTFYSSENGIEIQYGYISAYNTYGITASNKNGGKFYFINVDITAYGSFADLYGMSSEDGTNFGFRVYKGKIVIGEGEEKATLYLK